MRIRLLVLSAMTLAAVCCAVDADNLSLRSTRPFRAAWWCTGPNQQTLLAALLRPTPRVPLHRERWEIPDGDFLDVDRLDGPAGSPVLVVLHGLEGSWLSQREDSKRDSARTTANPFLHALFPEHGGHGGFLSDGIPGLPTVWWKPK